MFVPLMLFLMTMVGLKQRHMSKIMPWDYSWRILMIWSMKIKNIRWTSRLIVIKEVTRLLMQNVFKSWNLVWHEPLERDAWNKNHLCWTRNDTLLTDDDGFMIIGCHGIWDVMWRSNGLFPDTTNATQWPSTVCYRTH